MDYKYEHSLPSSCISILYSIVDKASRDILSVLLVLFPFFSFFAAKSGCWGEDLHRMAFTYFLARQPQRRI